MTYNEITAHQHTETDNDNFKFAISKYFSNVVDIEKKKLILHFSEIFHIPVKFHLSYFKFQTLNV